MTDDDRLAQLLGVAALAAHDALTRALTAGETRTAILVHLSAQPGGSAEALRQVLGLSQAATVRAVDGLVRDGLLERGRGADRRSYDLRPTAAGRRAARRALAARAEALRPLVAGLDAPSREALGAGLEALVAGLAEDRSGALHTCRLCDRGTCCAEPGCPLEHIAT
jgi:MarR family transcriptional regulator, negative regulator of the multidrug operon emrRAB